MEDLQNLQYLSIVSKICTELNNHLNINGKDLAEFIIHMAQSSDSYDLFRRKLAETDADISQSCSSNLYRIVQKMSSTQTKKSTIENNNSNTRKTDVTICKAIWPVLCKPNDPSVRVS